MPFFQQSVMGMMRGWVGEVKKPAFYHVGPERIAHGSLPVSVLRQQPIFQYIDNVITFR
jgi:hypothetical protein